MQNISIPLQLNNKGLAREESTKKSIDDAIGLLLTTAQFSTPADPQYGFVFINLRFEIFNETEGVVYNSAETTDSHGITGLYSKKISGSSKNMNTFAAELKDSISIYEKRLSGVSVAMTYIREKRLIYITVKGTITSTDEPYLYSTTISVWK